LSEHSGVIHNLLFTEFMVWDAEFSVAGTADFLVWNPETKCVDIWDWKTNTSITDSRANFGKYGFGGLAKLADTNYWHYALQLSIYRYIIEKQGIKCGALKLVHLTEEGYKVIELPYLADEVYIILKGNQE